jgi:hypothetical protein
MLDNSNKVKKKRSTLTTTHARIKKIKNKIKYNLKNGHDKTNNKTNKCIKNKFTHLGSFSSIVFEVH